MDSYRYRDNKDLAVELLTVPLKRVRDGSGHSCGDGTKDGWINGLSMTRLSRRSPYAAVNRAVDFIADGRDVFQVMVNRLDARSKLDRHRDSESVYERFHLPVVTNAGVVWWDEFNGEVFMRRGFVYGPVPYSGVLHSMVNDGFVARVHLVVDLV